MDPAKGEILSYLVDTDVLSLTVKEDARGPAVEWWVGQQITAIFVSVIVLHEIRYGTELLPDGKRKQKLEVWLARLSEEFAGRILPVDEEIADLAGRMLAASKVAGHTGDVGDALIAASAKVHGLRVATLNRKHFERFSVELVEF